MRLQKPDVLGWSLIIAAMMLLLLPLKWLIAAMVAAAFHEFCHWGMIFLCKGRVTGFNIGTYGAVMQVEELPTYKELLCALAGPLGGLCLVFFAKWIPRTAFCALIQSVYNLLPLFPLDGGRIMKCTFQLFLPERAVVKICNIVAMCFKVLLSIASVWAAFVWKAGIFPIIFAALLNVRTKNRKPLQNERSQGTIALPR